MKLPQEGGCLCGDVRYRLEREPLTLDRERIRAWRQRTWVGAPPRQAASRGPGRHGRTIVVTV